MANDKKSRANKQAFKKSKIKEKNDFTVVFVHLNGTLNNTEYNYLISAMQLDAGYSNGTFTSQIFDASSNQTWNSISWTRELCYQCEFPNYKAAETGNYLRFANMTGNVFLMHLNELSGKIIDFSGNGKDGTNKGAIYGASGKFSTALNFDGINDYVDMGTGILPFSL